MAERARVKLPKAALCGNFCLQSLQESVMMHRDARQRHHAANMSANERQISLLRYRRQPEQPSAAGQGTVASTKGDPL